MYCRVLATSVLSCNFNISNSANAFTSPSLKKLTGSSEYTSRNTGRSVIMAFPPRYKDSMVVIQILHNELAGLKLMTEIEYHIIYRWEQIL